MDAEKQTKEILDAKEVESLEEEDELDVSSPVSLHHINVVAQRIPSIDSSRKAIHSQMEVSINTALSDQVSSF